MQMVASMKNIMSTSENIVWSSLLTGYVLLLKICKKTRQDVRRDCPGCNIARCSLRSTLQEKDPSLAVLQQLLYLQRHLSGNSAIIKNFLGDCYGLLNKDPGFICLRDFSHTPVARDKQPKRLSQIHAQLLTGPTIAFYFSYKLRIVPFPSPLPRTQISRQSAACATLPKKGMWVQELGFWCRLGNLLHSGRVSSISPGL